MKHWTWALGMAGAGMALWVAWSSGSAQDDVAAAQPSSAPSDQALAGLQSGLGHLSRRLTRLELREQSARGSNTVSEAAQAAPAPSEPEPAAEAPDPLEAELTTEERVEHKSRVAAASMERVLAGEVRDEGWEREATQTTEALLAQLDLPGSSLGAVDCGERLCRVSIQHDGEAARRQFMGSQALLRPPLNTELFGRYDAENGETQIYLARRGDKLPEVTGESSLE